MKPFKGPTIIGHELIDEDDKTIKNLGAKSKSSHLCKARPGFCLEGFFGKLAKDHMDETFVSALGFIFKGESEA